MAGLLLDFSHSLWAMRALSFCNFGFTGTEGTVFNLLGQVTGLTSGEMLQIVSTVLTAFGAAWAVYVGFKTRQLDTKLELAKIEAAKEGRRTRRQVKQLDKKQDGQSELLGAIQKQAGEIQKQTNGTQEQLVRLAHEDGKRSGAETEKARAAEIVAEVAKVVADKVALPVVVTNSADHPVPVETK